jgi:hypothetical protein
VNEHHVSRVAVLSIVLTLAGGPYGSLLCVTLCQPEAAASTCRHQQSITSPVVAADHGCAAVVHDTAFLKEDLPRGGSASDTQHAVLVPRYQFAISTPGNEPAHEATRLGSPDNQPLDTVLRR